jgi:hypothetical protein
MRRKWEQLSLGLGQLPIENLPVSRIRFRATQQIGVHGAMMKTTSAVIFLTAFSLLSCSKHDEQPFLTYAAHPHKADAYHVVAYRYGAFIIEHKGQRLTVKCERAVTWPNDRLLIDPGQCLYIKVGEYIGEDLMVESDQQLQYYPYRGEKTAQTADIMTIIDIEEIR